MPLNKWTDEEWIGKCNVEQCEYLGYMMGRANELLEQERVKKLMLGNDYEEPHDLF